MIKMDLKNNKNYVWLNSIFVVSLFLCFCFAKPDKALAGELVFSDSYSLSSTNQTFIFDLPTESVLFFHVLTQYWYFSFVSLDNQEIDVSFKEIFRQNVDFKEIYGYKSLHALQPGTHTIEVTCLELPCYLDVLAFSGVSTTTTSMVLNGGDNAMPVSNVLDLSIASSTLGFNNSGIAISMVGTLQPSVNFSTFTPTTGTVISDLSDKPIGSFYFPTTGAGSWDMGFNGSYSPAGSIYTYVSSFWVADTGSTIPVNNATTTPLSREYYRLGGYTVPQSINCYRDLQNCDMVFGFDFSVYSRSIASTSSTLWSYPAFTWFWPNSLGQDVASGTIRHFIDLGVAEGLALPFQFKTPTSSTNYVLQIYDPLNSIGTTTDFVVKVNLIGTSTSPDVFSSCLGKCSSGLLGDLFCGVKLGICWGLSPSKSSYLYLSQSAEKLRDKFPFSLSFELLDALKLGLLTTDDRSGVFRIPMRQATTTGSELIWIEVANASTTEKTIGKDNYILIRNSIVWIAWLLVGIFISKLLFFKNK